jgi:hypothetical protein
LSLGIAHAGALSFDRLKSLPETIRQLAEVDRQAPRFVFGGQIGR